MESRLQALADASARIFAARSLDETLRFITEAARDLVGAHQAVTSLTTGPDWSQAIQCVLLSDKYAAWRAYEEKPNGAGIYTRVCAHNRPMRFTQAELESHPAWRGFGAAKDRHPPMRGWLAVPLVARDGANLGLIQLSDKYAGEFDAEDETVLLQLARLGALAVENQRHLEARAAAERRFEAFATLGNEVLWETDAQHRYSLFIAKGTFQLRRPPQAFIGKTRWEALGLDTADPVWAAHIADLAAHRPLRGFEYQAELGDGKLHWLRLNAEPQFDAAGAFTGYRGTTQDVTELRAAEAAAKANERRFYEFANLGSDVLWETDENHICTYISERPEWKGRRPASAFLGKTRWQIVGADPSDPFWAAHIADLDAHRPIQGFEYHWTIDDGSVRYVRVNGRPRFDESGKFRGYRGTTTDVTAARLAENEAKANERRFSEFAEVASDVLWETDANHLCTFISARPGWKMSRPLSWFLGKTRWDAIGADPAAPQWQAHIADLDAHRPIRHFEYSVAFDDGSVRYVQVNGQPRFDDAGTFLGYRGATSDVTALRKAEHAARAAEAAAKASEERFRQFAEIASDWVWETDAQHRFNFFSGHRGVLDQRPYGLTRWDMARADTRDPKWRAHIADHEARRPFRNFEYSHRDMSGRLRHVAVSGEPVLAPDGAFLGYRGTATDLTAQREAEAEARKAAEQYRAIVETAIEGVWIIDENRRTVFANARMAEMLGCTPEELLGRDVSDFRPPEDRAARDERWARRRQGISEQRESRFQRRDGSVFWAQVSASAMRDANGDFAGALGMVSDITARKEAEAALRASEQRFRDFAEVGADWLWESDAEHRITKLEGPPAAAADFALGKRRWEYGGVDPEAPEWRRLIGDMNRHVPFRNFEYRARGNDGRDRHFALSGKPLFGADGAFLGYRGTTRDITGQRAAEAKLKASEERFRDFAQVASDWMWESDAQHRFSYFSPSRNSSQPDSSIDAMGKTRWAFAGGDPADPKWRAHIADLEAHRPFRGFEYNYRRPDGSLGTYIVSGVPVFADDGAFRGYRGTTSDITAQRNAEAAARESERKFRTMVETAHEGIWLLDLDRRTTYVNPRMAEMLGYVPAEMLGRPHWDFLAPEDRSAAMESTRQRLGDAVERVELRYLRKDGSPVWVIVTSNIVEEMGTGRASVLGMVTDITDRKRAEEAAVASEARFRDFAEIASDWMWETDREHRLTFISGEALSSENEPIGRTRWELAGAGPDDPQWRGHVAVLEAQQPFRDFEFTVKGRSGRTHHLVASGRPVFDDSGAFQGYRGTTTSRTQQREAEAAAAASERQFRQLVETAQEGIWIVDADFATTYVNPRMAEMLGYTLDEISSRPFLEFQPPEDRARTIEAWDRYARSGVKAFEQRMRHKDGSDRWMLVSATPQLDAEGRFTGAFGMIVDITDRKAAEQALASAKSERDAILTSISDGFVALDNEWRFTFVNPAAERIWNRKAADLLGKTLLDSLNVDSSNAFHVIYLESKRSGEPIAFAAYSDLFGKWIEVRGYPHPGGYTLFFDDVSEERRAHRRLLKSQKSLEAAREMNERLFETSLDLICVTDATGTFVEVNPGACQQFGYAKDELIGHNAGEFIDEEGLVATRAAMREARRSQSLHTFENKCRRKTGEWVPVNWSVAWSERERKFFLIGRDMSEQIAQQERLNRSQRLEAIGQLTGGIAHDFNNLLTVIMGNSDALARGLADREGLRRRAELSLEAARRAAELTAQLLAFARRQTLAPKAVEANRLVKDMHELVRRTLGAQIEIAVAPGEGLWLCKVDSTQLETALLNLALNARDAMPGGGRLTIATSNRTIAPEGAGELAAGEYVSIEVADTGTGMTPDVLARAFEPFFTTKDIGKGSGLGLAMVYGFVKQSGGGVAIESAPGRGTRITLYLPRAEEKVAAAVPQAPEGAPLPGGRETVLVVEDDPAVRDLVTEQLKALGYRVLVAGNGSTARNILYGGETVDLLFTDVMMPGGINGTQLAAEAEKQFPGLKILFTTGYSEVPALANARRGVALLRKPYKSRDLARTVRETLDAGA